MPRSRKQRKSRKSLKRGRKTRTSKKYLGGNNPNARNYIIPGARAQVPLIQAVYEQDLQKIQQLIADGEDVNEQKRLMGTTPLMMAIIMKNHEIIQYLLTVPGIDVNIQDYSGSTALIRAVKSNSKQEVRVLLMDPRVDLNILDRDGKTALDYAIEKGYDEIANMIQNRQRNLEDENANVEIIVPNEVLNGQDL
jgi:ankyrin repeat protein